MVPKEFDPNGNIICLPLMVRHRVCVLGLSRRGISDPHPPVVFPLSFSPLFSFCPSRLCSRAFHVCSHFPSSTSSCPSAATSPDFWSPPFYHLRLFSSSFSNSPPPVSSHVPSQAQTPCQFRGHVTADLTREQDVAAADAGSSYEKENQRESRQTSDRRQHLTNLLLWVLFAGSGVATFSFLLYNSCRFLYLLCDYPPPVQLIWNAVKSDSEVREVMGNRWFTYGWLWSGHVDEYDARIKLQLYGIGGHRGTVFGDLCKDRQTGEWKILVLNCYSICNTGTTTTTPSQSGCPHKEGGGDLTDDNKAAAQGHSTNVDRAGTAVKTVAAHQTSEASSGGGCPVGN
eukprot:GHVS01045739.1.p1 GENE.GHVS01045739.1~~GHVS01045739.1.p1  ORF type:complete len:343 (+),score=53.23 GHVS01045739.1:177-1205(+)